MAEPQRSAIFISDFFEKNAVTPQQQCPSGCVAAHRLGVVMATDGGGGSGAGNGALGTSAEGQQAVDAAPVKAAKCAMAPTYLASCMQRPSCMCICTLPQRKCEIQTCTSNKTIHIYISRELRSQLARSLKIPRIILQQRHPVEFVSCFSHPQSISFRFDFVFCPLVLFRNLPRAQLIRSRRSHRLRLLTPPPPAALCRKTGSKTLLAFFSATPREPSDPAPAPAAAAVPRAGSSAAGRERCVCQPHFGRPQSLHSAAHHFHPFQALFPFGASQGKRCGGERASQRREASQGAEAEARRSEQGRRSRGCQGSRRAARRGCGCCRSRAAAISGFAAFTRGCGAAGLAGRGGC